MEEEEKSVEEDVEVVVNMEEDVLEAVKEVEVDSEGWEVVVIVVGEKEEEEV